MAGIAAVNLTIMRSSCCTRQFVRSCTVYCIIIVLYSKIYVKKNNVFVFSQARAGRATPPPSVSDATSATVDSLVQQPDEENVRASRSDKQARH